MNLFQRYLTSLKGALADERKQAKDAFFIELTLDCERLAKRPMSGTELRMLYSLDNEQTEVLHRLISEANKG
jgi:hypothetical protein